MPNRKSWLAVTAPGTMADGNGRKHLTIGGADNGHGCDDRTYPSSNGRHVYVANSNSNNVSVIDTRALKVIDTLPAGIDRGNDG